MKISCNVAFIVRAEFPALSKATTWSLLERLPVQREISPPPLMSLSTSYLHTLCPADPGGSWLIAITAGFIKMDNDASEMALRLFPIINGLFIIAHSDI